MSLPAARPHRGAARLETAVVGAARIATVSSPFPEVLRELVDCAGVALPSDACSLLVRTEGSDDVVLATDADVHALTADGATQVASPLAETLTGHGTVTVGRVHTDPRWPDFGRRSGGLSLRSLVTSGVVVDARTTALLTHWSTDADAFDPTDVADAAEFAGHVAPVLLNAVCAGELRRRNENLVHALTSRAVIDQAIGIVMSRTGASADEAFDRLRTISQREHVKVHEVAQRTVRDAVNRARARLLHSSGGPADVAAS